MVGSEEGSRGINLTTGTGAEPDRAIMARGERPRLRVARPQITARSDTGRIGPDPRSGGPKQDPAFPSGGRTNDPPGWEPEVIPDTQVQNDACGHLAGPMA